MRYDGDILMDLMGVNKDIVVPNTLWHQEKSWEFWVSPAVESKWRDGADVARRDSTATTGPKRRRASR